MHILTHVRDMSHAVYQASRVKTSPAPSHLDAQTSASNAATASTILTGTTSSNDDADDDGGGLLQNMLERISDGDPFLHAAKVHGFLRRGMLDHIVALFTFQGPKKLVMLGPLYYGLPGFRFRVANLWFRVLGFGDYHI